MKEDKLRSWAIVGAGLGLLGLGAFGFVFGKFGFTAMDATENFTELRDPDATGALFGWVLAFVGIPVGARFARQIGERYRARKRRRDWLAKHPEQATEIESQKKAFREEQRRRRSRRRRQDY